MKKILILTVVAMLTLLTSVAMADLNGQAKEGKLFLVQKCDASLMNTQGYDASGCPLIPSGPWPPLNNDRYGKMDYNLWGPVFDFSFEGKGLEPFWNYTLIYYPDPWPGTNLICLGSGMANWRGDVKIKVKRDIGISLPESYDANYNPINPSGAVGAKIWLVVTGDVECGNNGTPEMTRWHPEDYLFEYNLIVYERLP